MKLTKEIFTKLNEEKKKADTQAFNVDVAIQSLQNICEHEYYLGHFDGQFENPSCKICGHEFVGPRDESNKPERIVVDDVDKLNIGLNYELIYGSKVFNLKHGQSPRGIRIGDKRPNKIRLVENNLIFNQSEFYNYVKYLVELCNSMGQEETEKITSKDYISRYAE